MKLLPLLALVITLKTYAAPQLVIAPPPTGNIRLSWDYDPSLLGTNLWFNIYETTNLTTPLSQWNLLTNVPGTNLSVDLTVGIGAHFIVGTSSNFWGESSITSNIVSTPAAPVPMNGSLKIQKLP